MILESFLYIKKPKNLTKMCLKSFLLVSSYFRNKVGLEVHKCPQTQGKVELGPRIGRDWGNTSS